MKTSKKPKRLLAGIIGLLILAGVAGVAWLALDRWQRTYDRGSNSGWTLQMMVFFIGFGVWIVGFILLTPKVKGGSRNQGNSGSARNGLGRWRGFGRWHDSM